ncbi:hypothetical protein Salat_1403900 [Sesamum alatum]|uniref:Uncharacterized protein n=1 Tax=Sesamum alatum TaxID=300844 RepID=A0AAE1Y9W3_9LAMI|nr:hypothetical protein Salat_1403900 [Sesamum alatum]
MFLSDARTVYLPTNQEQLHNSMRREIETLHERTSTKLQSMRDTGKIQDYVSVVCQETRYECSSPVTAEKRSQLQSLNTKLNYKPTALQWAHACFDPLSEVQQCLSPDSDALKPTTG